MTHVLLKTAVAIPSKNKFHPELIEHLPIIGEMAKAAEERNGLTWDYFNSRPGLIEVLESVVTEYADERVSPYRPYRSGIYSFPFLHPDYVDDLLTEICAMSFEVNEEEEAEVQIPEITLQDTCPSLHQCLHSLFLHVVKPLSAILYQLEPKTMQSIQFAQYTPEEVSKGNWHHDEDSDITLVVALTDTHKGGGTLIKPQGFGQPFEVPQLPVGHALLFQGSRTLHKGLPVTEGARNLLVFWSTIR